jgi:hypothetical protein
MTPEFVIRLAEDSRSAAGVKTRKAHSEHVSSGSLPTADIVQRDRHFAFGPIAVIRSM